MPIDVRKCADAEFGSSVAKFVVEAGNAATAERGRFVLALAGGSLVKSLVEGLTVASQNASVDFSAWHIFLCDERVVPHDHPDSTFGDYTRTLASAPLSTLSDRFYPVQIPDDADISDIAENYEKTILNLFESDVSKIVFDMILLGMGPDGHVCSLFPGHSALNVTDRAVTFLCDSPKPPPKRVTLTTPVLLAARHVTFAVGGASKADVVASILNTGSQQTPAGYVTHNALGQVTWFIDSGAAKQI